MERQPLGVRVARGVRLHRRERLTHAEVGTMRALTVGAGALTATVVGASAAAASVSTVLLATGGAAAIALVGYGLYRWLSR
jgi:uncharacterized membrane protein YebE (DUF533 family)